MPTIKIIKPKRQLVVQVDNIDQALRRFTEAMEEAESSLVERNEEMEALRMCILTRSHLMLEGKHGIAKSKLARLAFSRITEASHFTKMLMKTTQTDELFGPLDTNRYREDAVWKHNIDGYLPSAHFAFLDEVYRASEQALPSMLGIMNERLFVNGDEEIQCPLITCIGTTNFTIDTDELKAYHDRWHVTVDTQPLSNDTSIKKMFELFLAEEREEEEIGALVTLEDIEALHRAVARVSFPSEMMELAISLCSRISVALGNKYISDRRKCIALRFAQANAVLDARREVNSDDLEGLKYALIMIRNHTQEQAWDTTYNSVVGSYNSSRKDTVVQTKLADYVAKLRNKYDDKMSQEKAAELWKITKQALSAIENQDEDSQPKSQKGIEMQQRSARALESLMETLKPKVTF